MVKERQLRGVAPSGRKEAELLGEWLGRMVKLQKGVQDREE